jgi:RHS repeat-associated protein
MVEAYVGGQWVALSTTERDFLGRLPLGIETSFADGSSKSWRFLRGPDASGTLEGAGGARGVLAVLKDGSSWKAVASDTLGNVLALAGTGGDFTRRTFDPWGNPLVRDASGSLRASTLNERRADYDALPLAWASQEVDPDTGLSHYHFREYSPSLGGWLTQDPIGLAGGYLNLRSYLGNRPADALDLWGEKYESDWMIKGREMEARGDRLEGFFYQMMGMPRTIWNSHVGIYDEMGQGLAESDDKFRAGEQDGSISKWEAFLYYSLRATTCVSSFRGAGALTGGVKLTDSLARDFGGTTNRIWKTAKDLPGKVVSDVGSAVQDPTNLSALWRVTDDAINVRYTVSTAKGVASIAKEVALKSSLVGSLKAGAEALRSKAIEQAKAKCPPCKTGAGQAGGLIIGKLEDLEKDTGWRPGDRTLNLPPLPPGPERWNQNAKALQGAINEGKPIRDVSPAKGGGFLDRERQLLRDNGWKFDPNTNLWQP